MKKVISVIICLALIVGVYFAIKFVIDPITTEIAYYTTYEESITAEAVILFNEEVYKAPHGIVVESSVMNGEKVAKNKKIASIYKSEIPMQIKNEIIKLERQISELTKTALKTNVFVTDNTGKEATTNQKVKDVINAVYSGDVSSVWRHKDQLNKALSSNTDASNINEENTLEELRKKRDSLEAEISASKTDIYSKKSGIFSLYIDGFEELLTVNGIKNITSSDLDKIISDAKAKNILPVENINAGEPFCKIIDSTIWYIACSVTDAELENFKEGATVQLRLEDADSSAVPAKVEYIGDRDENGKHIMLVSANKYISEIYEKREFVVDIIGKQISGLKVSTSAVRVKDGKKGVYIDQQGVATFRECEILYYNDQFAIIKQVNSAKSLIEYDKVIISGKNIRSGKLLE